METQRNGFLSSIQRFPLKHVEYPHVLQQRQFDAFYHTFQFSKRLLLGNYQTQISAHAWILWSRNHFQCFRFLFDKFPPWKLNTPNSAVDFRGSQPVFRCFCYRNIICRRLATQASENPHHSSLYMIIIYHFCLALPTLWLNGTPKDHTQHGCFLKSLRRFSVGSTHFKQLN